MCLYPSDLCAHRALALAWPCGNKARIGIYHQNFTPVYLRSWVDFENFEDTTGGCGIPLYKPGAALAGGSIPQQPPPPPMYWHKIIGGGVAIRGAPKLTFRVPSLYVSPQHDVHGYGDSDFAILRAHKWLVVWRWQAQRTTFHCCCLHIRQFLVSLGFGSVGTSTKKAAGSDLAAELFPLVLMCATCGWLLCVAHVA